MDEVKEAFRSLIDREIHSKSYYLGNPDLIIYLCGTTGKRNPQGKKVSSSLRENLDNFFEQMDIPLWYVHNAFWHCAHRQESLLLDAPSRGSLKIDRFLPFYIPYRRVWNLSAQNII